MRNPLTCNRHASSWAAKLVESFRNDRVKIRQIGDPVLRRQAKPVEIAALVAPEFRQLCNSLVSTMRRNHGGGIAAPQIGVSLRIIALEFTGHDLKMAMKQYGSKGVTQLQMSLFPLKVLINPVVNVTDPTLVTLREGCLSVQGYKALVPRAKEIQVEALNVDGNIESFRCFGWTARLIQHEMDHLNGNLFIDSMVYKSLVHNDWRDFCG